MSFAALQEEPFKLTINVYITLESLKFMKCKSTDWEDLCSFYLLFSNDRGKKSQHKNIWSALMLLSVVIIIANN